MKGGRMKGGGGGRGWEGRRKGVGGEKEGGGGWSNLMFPSMVLFLIGSAY